MEKVGLISYGGATKCTINLGIISVIRPYIIDAVTHAFGNSAGVGCMQAFMTDQCREGIEVTAKYLNVFRLLQWPTRGVINLDRFRKVWLEKMLNHDAFWHSHIIPHIGVYNVERYYTKYIIPTRETLVPLFMGSAALPRLAKRIYHTIDGERVRLLDGGLEDLTGYTTIRRDFPEVKKLIIVGHIPYLGDGYRYPDFLKSQILRQHHPDHPAKYALIKSYRVFMEAWEMMERDPFVLYLGPDTLVQGKTPVWFVDTERAIYRGYAYGEERGRLALSRGEIERFLSL